MEKRECGLRLVEGVGDKETVTDRPDIGPNYVETLLEAVDELVGLVDRPEVIERLLVRDQAQVGKALRRVDRAQKNYWRDLAQ